MPDLRLARLAAATAIGTWLLVVLGGVVRLTGSGMGCPDWPTCYGAVTPPAGLAATAHLPAWIEMAHRYGAALVGLLVVATAALAVRRRADGAPWRSALVALAVLVAQVLVGAVTVWQRNAPWTVTAHLAVALALVAATVTTALLAVRPGRATPDGAAWLLLAASAVLALVGSVVQTTGGGWACPDLPFCQGQLWPVGLGLPATAHMLHRALVLVTALALAGVALEARRTLGAPRRWARLAMLLFGAQALVGVAQVMSGMPPVLRGAHLALAAGFWAAVVGLALRQGQLRAARAAEDRSAASGWSPALRSS
jgi:cytochrome c oxidase assembly protein subunit 15